MRKMKIFTAEDMLSLEGKIEKFLDSTQERYLVTAKPFIVRLRNDSLLYTMTVIYEDG